MNFDLLFVTEKLFTAARIPEAIFEQDFHDSSFGYRRGRGAKDAVKELTGTLQFGEDLRKV